MIVKFLSFSNAAQNAMHPELNTTTVIEGTGYYFPVQVWQCTSNHSTVPLKSRLTVPRASILADFIELDKMQVNIQGVEHDLQRTRSLTN